MFFVPSFCIFLSHWNYSKLEIGILDNLLREGNGFDDFSNLNCCKILLKFAVFFKNFEFFVLLDNEVFKVLQMVYLT